LNTSVPSLRRKRNAERNSSTQRKRLESDNRIS
jgi:hypothetical protein